MPYIDLGAVVGPQGEQGATGAQGIRGEQGLPGPNQVTNSTATPLTGILTGNGSVVGVASIDEAPTADSMGFARSGGTDKAIKGRVPVYGMGKNLLDNWYFVNPVNQRGATQYSGNVTAFDRWRIENQYGQSIELTSSGVQITGTSSVYNGIVQIFENQMLFNGKTLTISCLFSDGELLYASGMCSLGSSNVVIFGAGSQLDGRPYMFLYGSTSHLSLHIRCNTNTTKTLVAAKVEFGTEQTLCHNEGTEENPVWVLNEIPDYGEELRKCLQYYVRLEKLYTGAGGSYVRFGVVNAYSATIGMCFIPLPVPLKVHSTAPSIAFSNLQLHNGQSSFAVTDVAFRGLTYNGIYLDLTSSGLTTGAMYLLKGDYSSGGNLYTNGRLEISVEL